MKERTQEIRKLICRCHRFILNKDGSRNEDGNAVNSNWNDDKFKVNWNNGDNSNDNLSLRQKFLTSIRFFKRADFVFPCILTIHLSFLKFLADFLQF